MEKNISRRRFLKNSAATSVSLIIGLNSKGILATNKTNTVINPFVRMDQEGFVTVIAKHFENGQGISTGLATLLAEEMDADWEKVKVEFAPANAEQYKHTFWGYQATGNSESIANSFMQYRAAGAMAKDLMIRAASKKWGVKTDEIDVQNGIMRVGKKKGYFGEFVTDAVNLTPSKNPKLKTPDQFKLIGNDRMLREFKVEANIGAPQVSYRETIRGSAGGEGKFSRQTGGKGQYGHVVIEMEPGEPGSGFEFVNKIVGGVVPKEYIKPAEQGMKETCESGVIAGYPLIDVKCTLVHGSYHDVDSSEMAFKIAGSMAFKDGVKKCNPVLLEPMMKVEVEAPEDFLGSIIGDLSSRRGQVEGQSVEDGTSKISAKVPLAEMFGYATELRSMTQGRGIFSMEFDNYAEVPRNVAEAIISKNQGNS